MNSNSSLRNFLLKKLELQQTLSGFVVDTIFRLVHLEFKDKLEQTQLDQKAIQVCEIICHLQNLVNQYLDLKENNPTSLALERLTEQIKKIGEILDNQEVGTFELLVCDIPLFRTIGLICEGKEVPLGKKNDHS